MVLLEMKFLSVLERISLPGFCCFVSLSAGMAGTRPSTTLTGNTDNGNSNNHNNNNNNERYDSSSSWGRGWGKGVNYRSILFVLQTDSNMPTW